MLDLQLAANIEGWRLFNKRRADKAFLPVAKRIFQRDRYACQYCSFQANQYQEVVNIDGNYTNHKMENLVTACCFCVQCHFIESAGLDEASGGHIIYLPEMSQANLNSFCHVLFCALSNGTIYNESAQAIYRGFKFRSQPVENKYGLNTSNPAVLGQVILEYQAMNPTRKINILTSLRLLPSPVQFKTQLAAWAAAALNDLPNEPQ